MGMTLYLRQAGQVLIAMVFALAAAPLFAGWIAQCRAWLQNRSAPPLTQPYRTLHKLFQKEAALAHDASPLFRSAPYVLFGAMVLSAAIIPSVATGLPFAEVADAIALTGLFATARVFMALAAMDVGTAFGTFGARREMMIGFLAEPALLMVLFNTFLLSGSTALPRLVETYRAHPTLIEPSFLFASVAFLMVLLAENARIPIDNPATHLELTMIHEAMLLEYSGRHLALMEWAASLKLFNYACIGFALFLPWGIATRPDSLGLGLLVAIGSLIIKLAVAGGALALIETVSAKLRLFRAPEFLATAFLLAVLGLLVHLLVGGAK
jgi:formate hydrogenlyase subunit 4